MFGDHFYIMPMDDQWEVRAPNSVNVRAYPTEAAAIDAALSGARAAEAVTGIATLVRVRSTDGAWRQLDTEGRESRITSL